MFINGLGMACKAVGLLLAIAFVWFGIKGATLVHEYRDSLIWLQTSMNLNSNEQQAIVAVMFVLIAFITLFLFWVVGTLVSAVGQILKAVLDTAVNTSPLLSPEEKSAIAT